MEEIEQRVKEVVIRALDLDIMPEEIDADMPLFGVVLDSVATLEIVAGLEETFDFTVADDDVSPELFESVRSLADYVVHKLADVKAVAQ